MAGLSWAGLSLGAPLALWGLLALPLLWGIHMLHRRYLHRPITTLFLLDQCPVDSWRGSRLRRLLASRSLGLQTLALLLLVALAVDPRWLEEQSSLKVAVVVDHSASMSAFAEKIPRELDRALGAWGWSEKDAEFALYASTLEVGKVAQGSRLSALWPALRELPFDSGEHDVLPVLQLARQWAGPQGAVVFVGDQVRELPPEVEALGLGEVIDNVGIVGVEVQAELGYWSVAALVRNFSNQPQRRELSLESQPTQMLSFQARELKSLRWDLATAQIFAKLTLSRDAYPRDDQVEVVQPCRKVLSVAVEPQLAEGEHFKKRLAQLWPSLDWGRPESRLRIEMAGGHQVGPSAEASAQVETPGTMSALAVFYPAQVSLPASALAVVATEHELVRGLSWATFGLSNYSLGALQVQSSDEVLLWHHDRVLALLRPLIQASGAVKLELHFNTPPQASFWQHPAYVLLWHRFLERVSQLSPGYERRNIAVPAVLEIPLQNSEPLEALWDGQKSAMTLGEAFGGLRLSVSSKHQRLELRQNKLAVGDYAFQPASGLEGDFLGAASFRNRSNAQWGVSRQTKLIASPWKIFWIFLVASCLGCDWHWRRRLA